MSIRLPTHHTPTSASSCPLSTTTTSANSVDDDDDDIHDDDDGVAHDEHRNSIRSWPSITASATRHTAPTRPAARMLSSPRMHTRSSPTAYTSSAPPSSHFVLLVVQMSFAASIPTIGVAYRGLLFHGRACLSASSSSILGYFSQFVRDICPSLEQKTYSPHGLSAGVLINGVGLSASTHVCSAAVFGCVIFYAASKVRICYSRTPRFQIRTYNASFTRPSFTTFSLNVFGQYGQQGLPRLHEGIPPCTFHLPPPSWGTLSFLPS